MTILGSLPVACFQSQPPCFYFFPYSSGFQTNARSSIALLVSVRDVITRPSCALPPACGSPSSLSPSFHSKRISSGYAQPVTGTSPFRTDGSRRRQRATWGGALTSQGINMHTRVPTKAVINPLTVVPHTALKSPVFPSSCFYFSHTPPPSP
jgi:hypothetical protein